MTALATAMRDSLPPASEWTAAMQVMPGRNGEQENVARAEDWIVKL